MTWSTFATEAPELAASVEARLRAHPHHVIATLRIDGSPRASGTNVVFWAGELWIGCMPGAVKAADLRRDPRYSLHSAPLSEQLVGGDAKLAGRALRLSDPDAVSAFFDDLAGESGQRPPEGDVFRLDIEEASLVEVDGDQLVITSWRPGETARRRTR
jgi:hypothetical protein